MNLTLNVEESLPFRFRDFTFQLDIIRNPAPRGFGANHNAAFRVSRGEHFCVLNPHTRLTFDPFPDLISELGNPQ